MVLGDGLIPTWTCNRVESEALAQNLILIALGLKIPTAGLRHVQMQPAVELGKAIPSSKERRLGPNWCHEGRAMRNR